MLMNSRKCALGFSQLQHTLAWNKRLLSWFCKVFDVLIVHPSGAVHLRLAELTMVAGQAQRWLDGQEQWYEYGTLHIKHCVIICWMPGCAKLQIVWRCLNSRVNPRDFLVMCTKISAKHIRRQAFINCGERHIACMALPLQPISRSLP